MSLLEELSKRMGCSYLSDLHYCVSCQKLSDEINSISAEDYPLQEWQDTAIYLGLKRESYQTAEQVRTALLIRLKNPNAGLKANVTSSPRLFNKNGNSNAK